MIEPGLYPSRPGSELPGLVLRGSFYCFLFSMVTCWFNWAANVLWFCYDQELYLLSSSSRNQWKNRMSDNHNKPNITHYHVVFTKYMMLFIALTSKCHYPILWILLLKLGHFDHNMVKERDPRRFKSQPWVYDEESKMILISFHETYEYIVDTNVCVLGVVLCSKSQV